MQSMRFKSVLRPAQQHEIAALAALTRDDTLGYFFVDLHTTDAARYGACLAQKERVKETLPQAAPLERRAVS